MKRCSLADRLYYYCYRFVMKTPSRGTAHGSVTTLLATTVLFNLVGLHLISTLVVRIPSLRSGAFPIILFSVIIILFGGAYYYILKKNGERIVKECSRICGERASVIIGGLIVVETYVFPFTCAILAGYFHR